MFSEVVCLFGGSVINKLEGLLESEFTKRGRIEHHFYAMQSVSIIFIEIKKEYTSGTGRLDVLAQVLAESAGMPFLFLHFPLLPFVAASNFNDAANNISLRL
jgi:hypothetical protein